MPFDPVLRRRRESRPRLVVLCDVSLSTRNIARFWLHLVYGLQDLFSKVRTFVFVADLVEVTGLFEEQGLGGAVDRIFSGSLIDVDENSDFGRAATAVQRRLVRRGEPPHDRRRARRRAQQRPAAGGGRAARDRGPRAASSCG